MEQQRRERLESALKEAKEELTFVKREMEAKVRDLLMERSELEASNTFLKEQMQSLKNSKEQDEAELK